MLAQSALAAVGLVIAAALAGAAAQRLLGAQLGTTRTLLTGAVALAVLSPLSATIARPSMGGGPDDVSAWLLLLAGMCTLLAAMAFIVVVETLLPRRAPSAPIWGAGILAGLRRTRRAAALLYLAVRHVAIPSLKVRRTPVLSREERWSSYGVILRGALDRAGPALTKLGQLASARATVLPPPVRQQLALLETATSPIAWEDVLAIVEREWGEQSSRRCRLARTPVATASIGQVHRGTLASGEPVIVKVQRPGVAETFEKDLDLVVRLAELLERHTRWGCQVEVTRLAEELREAAREEVDYRVEATNLSAMLAGGVQAPRPVQELTTRKVLVMTEIEGRSLREATSDTGIDADERRAIAASVMRSLWQQILVIGHFHADPHASNIYITRRSEITFLDFGIVGRLDTDQRHHLAMLLLNYAAGDRRGTTHHLIRLTHLHEPPDLPDLEYALGRVMARSYGASGSLDIIPQLLSVATRFGLRVPGELAAVVRAMSTADAALREFAPGFDLVAVSLEVVREIALVRWPIQRVVGPEAVLRGAHLVDVARRTLNGVVTSPSDNPPRPAAPATSPDGAIVRTWALAAVTAVVAVVGAILLLAAEAAEVGEPGLNAVLGYFGLAIGGILGLRLLIVAIDVPTAGRRHGR